MQSAPGSLASLTVLSPPKLPTSVGFRFAYGAASCARHREEAERLGLAVRVVPDVRLGWDVDTPADLELPDLDLLPVPK